MSHYHNPTKKNPPKLVHQLRISETVRKPLENLKVGYCFRDAFQLLREGGL